MENRVKVQLPYSIPILWLMRVRNPYSETNTQVFVRSQTIIIIYSQCIQFQQAIFLHRVYMYMYICTYYVLIVLVCPHGGIQFACVDFGMYILNSQTRVSTVVQKQLYKLPSQRLVHNLFEFDLICYTQLSLLGYS